MKTVFYYETAPAGEKDAYVIAWFKVEDGAPAVKLCRTTATATGTAANVERALAYVAEELRRQNIELFKVEPDPMDEGMMMEEMNVHH